MARRAAPPRDPRIGVDPGALRPYLRSGERVVVAVRRHWATVAEPVVTAVLWLVVALWASAALAEGWLAAADLLLWLWFAFLARALLVLYEWRREWFVVTDRRLLLVYGFIVRNVDMMPLKKVTDMTYRRSVPGRLLGYGTFVLESAGQDQALSRINFIPRPDSIYQAVIGEIFRRDGDEIEAPHGEHAEEDDPTTRLSLPARLARHVGPRRRVPEGTDPDTDSLPVTPGVEIYRSRGGPRRPEPAAPGDEEVIYRIDPTGNRDD